MKKYYEQHELAYQRLIATGYVGWDHKKSIDDLLAFPYKQELSAALSEHCSPGSRVLDIGCGTGPIALSLAQRGYEAVGIDISHTAVHQACSLANELALDATFVCGDVLVAELPYATYDAVIDSSFLHCIVFDEDRDVALKRIQNLLKPGGIFVLHTMISDREFDFGPQFKLDDSGILWFIERDSALPQRRLLPAASIKTQLVQIGLTEIASKTLYANLNGPLSLFGVYQRPQDGDL